MNSDVIGGLLVIGGAVLLLVVEGLPPAGAISGDPSAIFWPTFLLGSLAVLGATLVVTGLRTNALQQRTAIRAPLVLRSRSTIMILATLAYVPVLAIFGFYVAAFGFALVGSRLMGSAKWRNSLVFSVVLVGALWLVLDVLLNVQPPEGSMHF